MRRCALSSALRGLTISSLSGAHQSLSPRLAAATRAPHNHQENVRAFSSTASRPGDWLEPAIPRSKKMFKGRPRVRTGGSTKGTTVVYGDWGLRMIDHHRRISAAQLKVAEETIKRRLRGERYRFYKRVTCNIGVFMSGNEVRMGKGKGSFDHWATRVAVNQIVLELKGRIHEKVARDAFRLAGEKLPGQWEFVKKGAPPVVGITPLDGVTLEELKRPRRKVAGDALEPAPLAAAAPAESQGTLLDAP